MHKNELHEQPVTLDGAVWISRRNNNEEYRYQVFTGTFMGPVGYLELHYCTPDCSSFGRSVRGSGWAARVLNHRSERLGCEETYLDALRVLADVMAKAHDYVNDTTLTDEERVYALAGLCVHETSFGAGGRSTFCGGRRAVDDLYKCEEHHPGRLDRP